LVQERRHEAIAQNLANVSTTGFRRQVTTFHTFPALLAQQTAALPAQADALLAATVSDATTGTPGATSTPVAKPPAATRLGSVIASDTTAGETIITGNPTDLALHGAGCFVVQGPSGPLYTRNGAFRLDDKQQLVTDQGYPVLGEQGPITINGKTWTVAPTGAVQVNGATVDTLKLATFDALSATRQGTSLWSAAAATSAPATRVEQGALEGSNVNALTEMVALITATRQFEANMRCLQAQDSTLERAVNDLGRV
jgi:flagellar basal-body rod protein FlgF